MNQGDTSNRLNISLNTTTGIITVNVEGYYLITYGVRYTVASASDLPIRINLTDNGLVQTRTLLHSGVNSSLDDWLVNSSILHIPAGGLIRINNASGHPFNLSYDVPVYITFVRIA